jgi:hypothetical protein
MRVHDAGGKGTVHRLAQHGAEAGHGHQVDLMGHQGRRHRGRVALAIEAGAESAVPLAVEQLVGRAVSARQAEGGTGAIGDDGGHREPSVEHGFEDRPAPRDQDTKAHEVTLPIAAGRPPAGSGRVPTADCSGVPQANMGSRLVPDLVRLRIELSGLVVARREIAAQSRPCLAAT